MALHNAEQEIVRLQSILDSVAIIHPGTIRQLRAMNPQKQFKDRHIKDLAHSRASFASTAEDEANRLAAKSPAGEAQKQASLHQQITVPEEPTVAATTIRVIGGETAEETKCDSIPAVPPQSAETSRAAGAERDLAAAATVAGAATDESATLDAGVAPPADTSATTSDDQSTGHGLPPQDVPIDAVWVKPADASLVLRARQVHEVLQTDPSLQDTEEERKHYRARREVEARGGVATTDSSDTTSHALSFSRRITTTASAQASSSTSLGGSGAGASILARGGAEDDNSTEIVRIRSLLEFLLYEDAEKLMQSHPDPEKAGFAKEEQVPEERDEEDEMIAARQRNLRRLGRSGNWGSFVEDLAARFPLKHAVNLDAQDRLMRRIGDAKARRLRNETDPREPFNILKTRPKAPAIASFGV
jgi:hypothetical protein